MSKGPRMEKPIRQFIDECLLVNLQLKNGRRADRTAEVLMGTVKVYMLLTMRKPLVQDLNFEKHLSSGLGEKMLNKKGVSSPKKLKDLRLDYLHFTDKGLGYQKVYLEEVKGKGLSWLDFSLNILKDTTYYNQLVEMVEHYEGHLNGSLESVPAPVVVNEPFEVYEGSAAELREKAKSLFNDLYSLCESMDRKSHSMIQEKSTLNSTKQSEFYDFMLQNHSRYFAGAKSNETELKKLVQKAHRGFEDALVILCLIEALHK